MSLTNQILYLTEQLWKTREGIYEKSESRYTYTKRTAFNWFIKKIKNISCRNFSVVTTAALLLLSGLYVAARNSVDFDLAENQNVKKTYKSFE